MKKLCRRSLSLVLSAAILLECGAVPLLADESIAPDTEYAAVIDETTGIASEEAPMDAGFSGDTVSENGDTDSMPPEDGGADDLFVEAGEPDDIFCDLAESNESDTQIDAAADENVEAAVEEAEEETDPDPAEEDEGEENDPVDPDMELDSEDLTDPDALLDPETEEAALAAEALVGDGDPFVPNRLHSSVDEDVAEAISKFTEAMGKFMSDTSELSRLGTLLERFGGVTEMASGAIAILELIGIIQDPDEEALSHILTDLGKMETELAGMAEDLKKINDRLVKMQVSDDEKNRNNAASKALSDWKAFRKAYIDPLTDVATNYGQYVKEGIQKWWCENKHDGLLLCYTAIPDPSGKSEMLVRAVTFSKNTYEKGFPDYADNGEELWKKECLGIPSEYMPATTSDTWNVNTYEDVFNNLMVENFIAAANAKALVTGEGSTFYADWEAMDQVSQNVLAEQYAQDALQTLTYLAACKEMTKHDQFAAGIYNDFKNYSNYVTEKAGGIDLLISIQYNTHGFEGEAKDEIAQIVDSMVAFTGFYGTLALTAVTQDDMIEDTMKKDLKQKWVDTINQLFNKKKDSLTGNDSMCYVSGYPIAYDTRNLHASGTVTSRDHRAYSTNTLSKNWDVEDADGHKSSIPDTILEDEYVIMLYHQYIVQKDPKKDETFAQFLGKYGLNIDPGFKGLIIASDIAVSDFSLNNGIIMTAHPLYGDYFTSGKTYAINKGNASKIEDACFDLSVKVTADIVDSDKGGFATGQVIAANAAYLESHWYWGTDEATVFTMGADMSVNTRKYKVPKARGGWYTYYDDTTDWKSTVHFLKKADSSLDEKIDDSTPLGQLRAFLKTFTGAEKLETKAANPLRLSRKTDVLTLKASKLKKKAQTIKSGSAFTVSGAQGAVHYQLVNAVKVNGTKVKKLSAGKFIVNSTSGDITVKKGLGAGIYELTVQAEAAGNKEYDTGTANTFLTVEIVNQKKATQPLKVKTKNPSVKASALKKKKQVVKAQDAFLISKEQGNLTYSKVSGSPALTIAKKTGKITVKKGTKKGTYRIKVKVTASGDGTYAAGSKTATVKVKVK